METISLNISLNDNDVEEYKEIMIRKFFNMIFIGKDGMSLHIYTATIMSGGAGDGFFQNFFPVHKENRLNIKFQYDGYRNIRFTNISDSLFKQTECIEKVWGKCEKLSDTERILNEIKKVYNQENCNIELPDGIETLSIYDSNGSLLQSCVAAEGQYHGWVADGYYSLSPRYRCSGIEYLNWVKTEIELNHSIINNGIKFSIGFNFPENLKCYCPDYTWYICTPNELFNDPATAYVKFMDQAAYFNMMQALAKGTALKFNEWVTDEGIDRCNRCRLKFNGQKSADLSKKAYISIEMFIEELKEKHGNRQFLIGLLVAFFLAYFSDWTRVNEIYKLSFGSNTILDYTYIFDFIFPLNVILSYIALIIPKENVLDGVKKRYMICFIQWSKKLGICFSIINLLCFFVFFPALKLAGAGISDELMYGIIAVSTLIGLAGTIFYIVYSSFMKKINLYNFL